MASLNQQQPPLLQDVINQMRDNILRTQSNSHTAAITGFDNLVEQCKVFVNQINAQSGEVTRLQELCKKNKIDFAIPPPEPIKIPESKITPPPGDTHKPKVKSKKH